MQLDPSSPNGSFTILYQIVHNISGSLDSL